MTSLHFRVLAALLVSVALHGTLLAALRPSGAAGSPATPPSLHVRMLQAPRQGAATAAAPPAIAAEAAVEKPVVAPNQDSPAARQDTTRPAEPHSPARRADASDGSSAASERTPEPPAAAAPREPGLAPAPAYLLGAQLDPRPTPLDDIEPVFPPEAGAQEGMVLLRILISETGKVDDVAVIRSAPKGLFDSAAVVAFQSARFSPGKVLGIPVKSQINVQVDFTPFNRGAAVSGHGY